MDFLIFRVPKDMILLPQNQNPMVTLKLILFFFVLEFPIALKELLINFLGQKYESRGPMIGSPDLFKGCICFGEI